MGGSFSTAWRIAKDLGYIEPDPRDDLNGNECCQELNDHRTAFGMQIESAASVKVQSLVPGTFRDIMDGIEFLSHFAEFDEEQEKKRHLAEQDGKVLHW